MTVTEYEREFIRLSKYAWEYVSTEETLCKIFVDGVNKDIKLLVGILELKEFIVLVEKACKAEDLSKEKRKADSEARDSKKRSMTKSYHSSSKKSKDYFNRSTASTGYQSRDHEKQYTNRKAQTTSVSRVGNTKDAKPECQQCGRQHFGDCWGKSNNRACYSCGSRDHFIKDCPELAEKDNAQNMRSSNIADRGRPPRNTGNVSGSRGVMRDTTARSDARAPARATLFEYMKKCHLQML
ncbi:hypothetical protein PVK06_004817 [Gossypium arboreum]|uniref:CCHC-type domain-containing protein n=1 Tax=Gossypium arboreum TaxID=29729 RepID=A0ABR0QT19_GOSAR|nr:hypothetical protein PVK06_004817 [Gossypium arboreum]